MLPIVLAAATALAPVPTKLVDADNAFAADLYGVLAKKPGNLVLSPASVAAALAMTYAGAKGDTAKQMETVLHLPGLPFDVHAGYAALLARLESSGKGDPELHVANRLFGQKGLAFESAFLSTTKSQYAAELEPLDFATSAEPSRAFINAWVEKQTHERIKDLLPAGSIDGSTRLVLTNAVYFKGTWVKAFDKKLTKDDAFLGKKVPTMHASLRASLYEAKDAQVLELPYQRASKEHGLSMVIVLPKAKDGASTMGQKRLFELLTVATGSTKDVELSLPKFKATQSFELGTSLQALGMTRAFSSEADFSGMTKKAPLHISRAIHKTFIDVNEEGTEAAGATAIVMTEGAAVHETAVFKADHPYVFGLKDQTTGALLFVGRVDDPSS